MISIENQQNLLIAISEKLSKKITVYAIGGTAMMFMGFKDATLDIDLVFENEKDRKIFKQALIDIGYQEMDPIIVYGTRDNCPEMLTLGDERFDLFVKKVIDFQFSEQMMARATKVHQFKDNLILKIADPHDIILMKCATDRKKDIIDAKNIIEFKEIDWNVLVGEAKLQIQLGIEDAAFELGNFLEKLSKMKISIPKKVLDKLFKIVKLQAEKKLS